MSALAAPLAGHDGTNISPPSVAQAQCRAAPMARIYEMARHWIQAVLGLVFTLAALRLLWSAH